MTTPTPARANRKTLDALLALAQAEASGALLLGTSAFLFGIGFDGPATADGVSAIPGATLGGGNYTLSRDVMYTTFTINSGVTVNTNGFRVWCSQSATINGTLSNDGGSAAATVAGLGGSSGSVGGGTTGGAGATGVGAGSAATNFTSSQFFWGTISPAGGAGGASGADAGGAGGTSQAATPINQFDGYAFSHGSFSTALVPTPQSSEGGPGGGGGGSSSSGANGGGGGGGGGCLYLAAKVLTNNGTLSARGGSGAAGSGTGNAGGGGSGSGGAVHLVTTVLSTTPIPGGAVSQHSFGTLPLGSGTVTTAAGTPGAGLGTGAAGATGAVGQIICLAAS